MDLQKISAVIVVKNAETTIYECLKSLKKFGEIILLDNKSDDKTLKIVQNFKEDFPNIYIYTSEFIGFGALKNLALTYSKNEWILSIDADEVLEEDFLAELQNSELQKDQILALPRKNLYKKEWIKACGWYPDYVYRVFNKNTAKFNDNYVHESLIINGLTIIKCKNGLKHYAFESIYDLLEKMQRYSELFAQSNLHKKSSMSKSLARSIWKFVRDYFLKKGFLYGYKGFIISVCNALGVFFKYAKLYELSHKLPSCSLIITTYNNPDFLGVVLESVKKLEFLPDEVLIADDGSKEDTALLIKEYQKNFPCPLLHIWQKDEGFRLSSIRNKAAKAAKGEYLIIIDGDMVLDSHFVKDHLDFAKPKVYLQGSRVIVNENFSKKLLKGYDKKLLPRSFKSKRSKLLSNLIYKISKISASFFDKKELIKGIRGCNMSCFKQDYEAIGGFNENFKEWGREDSEFVARFLFNKGEFRRLKFKAIAYHLYHQEHNKKNNELSKNHNLYLQSIKNKKTHWK